jgi:hypothetical protein
MLFMVVAAAVWGGLGLSLRLMMKGPDEEFEKQFED